MTRYLRCVRLPLVCCVVGLVAVFISRGLEAAWVTLVLLALEISLSLDSAVVNARVLEPLTPGQQRFFLTWGLLIPVFGVRFLGPLVLVCLAGGIGIGEAIDAAMHHPEQYRALLEIAEPRILAFGGMFLLMVFLRYFFNEAKTLHWVRVLEARLSQAGRVESLEVALALVLLMAITATVPPVDQAAILLSGMLGLVLQILSTSLADIFGGEEEAVGRMAAGGGLVSLIYLEHGAHYAIGALGLLMLNAVAIARWNLHVPEWLSGLIGVVLLLLALGYPVRHSRRKANEQHG